MCEGLKLEIELTGLDCAACWTQHYNFLFRPSEQHIQYALLCVCVSVYEAERQFLQFKLYSAQKIKSVSSWFTRTYDLISARRFAASQNCRVRGETPKKKLTNPKYARKLFLFFPKKYSAHE